jgi:hypothetical protein
MIDGQSAPMDAMTGVAGVLGRINDITARFGGGAGGDPFVVVDSKAFDPFGAQYQAAVSTLQSGPTSASFSQSYSAPVPGASGVGGAGIGTPALRAARRRRRSRPPTRSSGRSTVSPGRQDTARSAATASSRSPPSSSRTATVACRRKR